MKAIFLVASAVVLSWASAAWSAATVTSVRGEVRAAIDSSRYGPASQGDRIQSGWTVSTGPNSQAVLRFDDGQNVVLNQNTEFKITEYRFSDAQPANDRSVFELLKGALRVVTGAIGKRNQDRFALRLPQVTIGVRGTDFMVVIVNPAYISVTQGAVAATNAAGTATFGAGALGQVASQAALATSIPASALPAAASSAFSSMSTVTLSATATTTAGTAGSAGGAAGGAAGTASGTAAGGTAAAVGAGVGAAAAGFLAVGGQEKATTTTTHH
jgi:hypothetical protein